MPRSEPPRDGELLPIGAAVARLRDAFPDLTPSAMRFLEQEGLLAPSRTAGGHRLYSPADLERVRQIKTWQLQRLSLAEIRLRLAGSDPLPAPEALADAFLRAALAGDLAAAYRAVVFAADRGMPLERIFVEVLQPALFELGHRWETGEVLVAQEKEISELVRDLIADLSQRHARSESGGPVLVAACVEGERHELGLCMVVGLLRARGYAVHFLGADVAPRFVLEAVRLYHPVAVLLSSRLALNVPAVKDAVAVLAAGCAPEPPPPVVVGGQLAIDHPDAIRAIGATPLPRLLAAADPFDWSAMLGLSGNAGGTH